MDNCVRGVDFSFFVYLRPGTAAGLVTVTALECGRSKYVSGVLIILKPPDIASCRHSPVILKLLEYLYRTVKAIPMKYCI